LWSAPKADRISVQDPKLIRADFVTALCLISLGTGTVAESWRMPRLEEMNINPYTVPGLVPGILGGVLLLLGAILLVRSARAGGWRVWSSPLPRASARMLAARRTALTLVLTFGYAAALVGRIPFWLATFLFVLGFVALFEWQAGRTRQQSAMALASAVLVAGITSATVTVVFQYLFLVRLP